MIFSVLRACCFLGILCLFIEASPVNSKLHTDCHIAHANASPDSTSKIDGAHVVHSEASCSSTASTLIDDPLQPTSEEIIIGYRYVEFEKAKEYNATKTLTAILASARSIGEGAYLSPKIGDFPGIFTPPWECIVVANKEKLFNTPMLYVPDEDKLNQYNSAGLSAYIKTQGLDTKTAILFSEHHLWLYNYQMLIPPYYLEKSPTLNPQGEHGENRLGIRAQCVPQGTLPRTTCPCADWKTWPIKKMPTSIKLCSTPASAH